MSAIVETSKVQVTSFCHVLFGSMSGFSLPMYAGTENADLVNVKYYHR